VIQSGACVFWVTREHIQTFRRWSAVPSKANNGLKADIAGVLNRRRKKPRRAGAQVSEWVLLLSAYILVTGFSAVHQAAT